MSVEAMKAMAMLENKASRQMWESHVASDAKRADISKPLAKLAHTVISEVALLTGIASHEIRGKSRRPPIAHARQFCFYQMHKLGISLSDIGRAFDAHHTTVMHGVRQVEDRLNPYKEKSK